MDIKHRCHNEYDVCELCISWLSNRIVCVQRVNVSIYIVGYPVIKRGGLDHINMFNPATCLSFPSQDLAFQSHICVVVFEFSD